VDHPTVPLSYSSAYPLDDFGAALLSKTYREHVRALNERVLDALGPLVEAVGDEAVIIVMSDHGSRTHGTSHVLSPADVGEQFSSFLAARTPDGEVLFGDDAMTTNVLSTVFNRYLGTDIPPVRREFESQNGTRYPE